MLKLLNLYMKFIIGYIQLYIMTHHAMVLYLDHLVSNNKEKHHLTAIISTPYGEFVAQILLGDAPTFYIRERM